MNRTAKDLLAASAFLAPFMLVYVLFLAYPFALGAWMSLHDWELLSAAANLPPIFIGLENYGRLLDDPVFWSSLQHTALFTALSVPAVTALGLALALALNEPTRRSTVLRTVFFLSGVLSVTVMTLIWISILNPSRGLLGGMFQALNVEPKDLLSDGRFAMPLVALATVWWCVGFPMTLFLAALQQIPSDLYEAAALDHAGPWARLVKITLPAVHRTTWLVITLQIISQFQIFGQVLLMTGGGPANSTRVLVQYIYESTFRDWEAGYASALSVVLFLLMLTASLIQFKLSDVED